MMASPPPSPAPDRPVGEVGALGGGAVVAAAVITMTGALFVERPPLWRSGYRARFLHGGGGQPLSSAGWSDWSSSRHRGGAPRLPRRRGTGGRGAGPALPGRFPATGSGEAKSGLVSGAPRGVSVRLPGDLGAVTDRTAREAAYMTLAEVCFQLAFRTARCGTMPRFSRRARLRADLRARTPHRRLSLSRTYMLQLTTTEPHLLPSELLFTRR